MREYVLMTDSCCDLPDQMAKDLQLEVLPLTMHMDGQDYPNTLDGAAISNEEFYRRIRAGKMATTSAVNVGQFEDAMSAILEQGKDILCISFSSALSTTYQSACIAAESVQVKYPEGRIRVIDSLSASLGQGLQLEVLPLTMHMDGQDYPNTLDGAAISNEEFYRRIRAGKMATTSAVNVGQFEDAMSAILEQGKDILCISFSSALSTTYQSACIAAESVQVKYPEGRIRVIDSLSASLGQGLLMYLTAHKKLEENLTLDQLGDWVEENKLHVCHWFTVDDLNYLKKGGRVSAATALVGTMLSIKPIMHTSDEGKLTVVGKARGRKSSLNTLIDTVGRLGINLQDQVMFICQADCQAEAETVAAQLKQRYGVKEVYINYIGPVIGSHTGPNTMGLFFVGTER